MHTPMKLAMPCCFVLVSTLVLSACQTQCTPEGNAQNSGVVVDAVGEYTLVSVDGKIVPATVSHDGSSLQVRSGKFSINADGSCSTTTVFVPPNGKEVAREVSAKYTQAGATLTMTWKGAGMTCGTIEGKTFTMNNEGMLFVYTK